MREFFATAFGDYLDRLAVGPRQKTREAQVWIADPGPFASVS